MNAERPNLIAFMTFTTLTLDEYQLNFTVYSIRLKNHKCGQVCHIYVCKLQSHLCYFTLVISGINSYHYPVTQKSSLGKSNFIVPPDLNDI